MIIGIDIRPLMDKHYTGISEYTLNLLLEIFKQDKRNKYKLFYNVYHDLSDRIPQFNFPNVRLVKMNYPNKLLNYVLFKILKRPKIDQELDVELFFMPHFNFIALSEKCKKIITIHDLSFIHYPYFFSHRKNFWHKNINIRKFLRQFDVIIAVSENTKRDLIELCQIPQKKIKVIYSGISQNFRVVSGHDQNLIRVKQKYNLPKKFILYLGNLEPRKNIEGLIEAYSLFRHNEINDFISSEAQEAVDKTDLVIAGSPSWKYQGIYETAKNSFYSNDIHFLNYVDEQDKPYLYNLAEVFIFPSFYEGFGFPPLEAAACGTPVIMSHNSSLSEAMGNSAILINPYDITEMAEAIKQVLSDDELHSSLRSQGLERVKRYRWSECAREVLEVFEEFGGEV